ncbi:hypothetical protein [Corynebacterium epidermidicanis]|uniref:DUF732 domain-containing protein n=1 Tax=Corynebacterium epidermidicanis TaxID=1050174 RepID=A0A0G3GTV4_9CORY|nr:hypothetical protein [Corynebacterium epidermidicanis]AKK03975.1 hypothetical protein CEPID_10730 [Corynebacterium epidermidicanis]
MKKLIASAFTIVVASIAPVAQAAELQPGFDFRHPSEIAREQAKTPLERLQDQALTSTMQASFLGMAVPDAIAAGKGEAFGPLSQCVTQVAGSAEIQPVQMVATWYCLATNPKLNPLPRWYV